MFDSQCGNIAVNAVVKNAGLMAAMTVSIEFKLLKKWLYLLQKTDP